MSTKQLDPLSITINKFLHPALSQHRFSMLSDRGGWRYKEDRIEVIQIWSPVPYGTTEFNLIRPETIQIQLGIFFWSIPQIPRKKFDRTGVPTPKIHECHMRNSLELSPLPTEDEALIEWQRQPFEIRMARIIKQARNCILTQGMSWFEKLNSPEQLFALLTSKGESADGSWGYGAPGSPTRQLYTGFLAKRYGDSELARVALEKVLTFKLYLFLHPQINSALNDLQ